MLYLNQQIDTGKQEAYMENLLKELDQLDKEKLMEVKQYIQHLSEKVTGSEEERKKSEFDQLCKRLIKTFFREFLDFFFPALAEMIDFSEVTFIDKELFSGQIEGSKTVSDILAQVKLINGEEEIVLLHFEVQSDRETDFQMRMFDYYIDIWRENKKKIFAFALFIDEAIEWKVPISDTFEMEFMGTEVKYKYHLKRTKSYNYKDYLDHENPITAALMTRMNFGKDSRPRVKALLLKKLKGYNLSPLQFETLRNFVDKLLFLNEEEQKELKEIIYKEEEFKEVFNMVTTWHEEGMKEGEIKKSKEIALKLIKKGYPIEDISDLTGLSVEEIQKLLQSN